MICGNCANDSTPDVTVRGLTICPACLHTLVADSGALAHGDVTTTLTNPELTALRALRKRHRQAKGVEG